MIAEKPTWITHEGMQIFSVDIQPGGLRFATGGGDHKVRIWNSKSVNRDLDINDANQRVLATLRDHFGSVNCVRWAKHGRLLASGSDDQVILVHERKPGSGTTEFGSGEPPDVENWKVALTLRGHVADVVDLNWSPDDSILASGSLDNTIHIWDMSNGICTAVLRGHSSLVKGVAWDPIGSFIASQSDDKSVIIWRTSDWSLAHRIDGHWEKSLGSTFFRRLGWSPCGHFITTTHGFQKPRHSAPVLERGEWAATFDFLGHNAPIIVVKFNHSMFKGNSLSQESKPGSTGWANGNAKIGGKETQPYNVIAIGSQDRTITVWTTASPRPLFVAKHFFTQSVVDLSWSPDGFSLFACSLDGTVATFHFDQNELGVKLTDSELEELKRSRYGDVRGRQTNLAESPAQLLLEEASAKQSASKKPLQPKVPVEPKSMNPRAEDGKKGETLVKQREYRRPDGRKRIIPEALGVPSSGNAFPVAEVPEENKTDSAKVKVTTVTKPLAAAAKATIVETLTVEKVASSREKEPTIVSPQTNLSITVIDKKLGDDTVPVCLEARPRQQAANDGIGVACENPKESEIVCFSGNQTLWSDRVWGKVTALTGNENFWAVGCDDGSLQVYTKCGRRAMPAMMIGSPATFVDCDDGWRLLVVTRKGALYVWDLFNKRCVLQNSLGSLVSSETKGVIKVISAKLSKCGSPLVVLATRNAFLFDMNLGCWLRVADDCFPASNFASSWNLGFLQTGELANLQVEMRKFMARKPGWTRVTDDGAQTRGHLEAQLASALALKSANEYRQCLLSYVRFLAREADESRLREVCESFLGPPGGIVEGSDSSAWESSVLGMRKHKLLREDILPAMASNRKVQRLLNEFMDLLSEYEEQAGSKPSTCPMECDPRPSGGDDSGRYDTQPASDKPSSCPDDANRIVPDTPMVGQS